MPVPLGRARLMAWRKGIDPPFWWKPWLVPWFAWLDWWYRPRPVKPPTEVTAVHVSRRLAWFRVCGWGLWVKWSSDPDLFTTRQQAHYAGRFRWKALRREKLGGHPEGG